MKIFLFLILFFLENTLYSRIVNFDLDDPNINNLDSNTMVDAEITNDTTNNILLEEKDPQIKKWEQELDFGIENQRKNIIDQIIEKKDPKNYYLLNNIALNDPSREVRITAISSLTLLDYKDINFWISLYTSEKDILVKNEIIKSIKKLDIPSFSSIIYEDLLQSIKIIDPQNSIANFTLNTNEDSLIPIEENTHLEKAPTLKDQENLDQALSNTKNTTADEINNNNKSSINENIVSNTELEDSSTSISKEDAADTTLKDNKENQNTSSLTSVEKTNYLLFISQCITFLGDRSFIEASALLESIAQNPIYEDEARGNAAIALAKIEKEAALPFLTSLLENKEISTFFKSYLLKAVGLTDTNIAFNLLKQTANKENQIFELKLASTIGLANMTLEVVKDPLITLSKNDNSQIREEAIKGLIKFIDTDHYVFQTIAYKYIKDPDSHIKDVCKTLLEGKNLDLEQIKEDFMNNSLKQMFYYQKVENLTNEDSNLSIENNDISSENEEE